MKYEGLRKRITRKYSHYVKEGVTYYLNKAGEVVATENETHNLLVMYVYSNKNTIFNHNNTVAVAVAKNFKLVKNYVVQIADIITIEGLCGSCNSIVRISDMLLQVTTSANLNFRQQSQRTAKIGIMGHMVSATKMSLDIGLKIDMSLLINTNCRHRIDRQIRLSNDNLVYGILSYKKLPRKKKKKHIIKEILPKYYNVYDYLRKKESWYWEVGYKTRGSREKRISISATMYGTNYHKIAPVSIEIIR